MFDNAIYVIRDRIDLGGNSVIIPAGCLLKFEGGFLYNGIVEGQMTKIKSDKRGHYNLKVAIKDYGITLKLQVLRLYTF